MTIEYQDMSAAELAALLERKRNRVEDIEDERYLVLEHSQSGHHIGSKYIQSRIKILDDECGSLQSVIAEICEALENKTKEMCIA
jgi:hypothetical protein